MSDGENKASPSNLVGGWVLAALWWLGGGWCDASARRRAADASSLRLRWRPFGRSWGRVASLLKRRVASLLNQAPRTNDGARGWHPADWQLTPDEQWVIQKELSNLKMRLLSVDRYILAVNTNQTNAMVKMNMKRNLKRNYDDVSRSPLL